LPEGEHPGGVPELQDNCESLSRRVAKSDKMGTHPAVRQRPARVDRARAICARTASRAVPPGDARRSTERWGSKT